MRIVLGKKGKRMSNVLKFGLCHFDLDMAWNDFMKDNEGQTMKQFIEWLHEKIWIDSSFDTKYLRERLEKYTRVEGISRGIW